MSAQPLVFEGPDPEQLLMEIWTTHGTNARISEPVRVRSGGVLGFFAKMNYRVEVDPQPQATPAPGPQLPRRSPAAPTGPAPTRPMPAVSPSASAGETRARSVAEAPASSTASALEQMVSSTEDVLEIRGAPERSFDEVLQGVASSLGEEPGSYRSGAVISAGDAGPRIRRTQAMPTSAPESAVERAQAMPTNAPESTVEPPRDPSRAASATPPPRDRSDAGSVRRHLGAIGFPLDLLAGARGVTSPVDDLEAAFSLLPAPPVLPDVRGALVAVVGDLGRALDVAGQLAEQLRLEDAEIAVASPKPPAFDLPVHLVASGSRQAAALSPGWRRDTVGLLAVDSTSPGANPAWIRSVLRASRPSATWVVTSATAKPEDVTFFVEAIGGADALVLDDIAATVTPAAVLATGIAVALLDGEPASPRAWADAVSLGATRPGAHSTGPAGPDVVAAPRTR